MYSKWSWLRNAGVPIWTSQRESQFVFILLQLDMTPEKTMKQRYKHGQGSQSLYVIQLVLQLPRSEKFMDLPLDGGGVVSDTMLVLVHMTILAWNFVPHRQSSPYMHSTLCRTCMFQLVIYPTLVHWINVQYILETLAYMLLSKWFVLCMLELVHGTVGQYIGS